MKYLLYQPKAPVFFHQLGVVKERGIIQLTMHHITLILYIILNGGDDNIGEVETTHSCVICLEEHSALCCFGTVWKH